MVQPFKRDLRLHPKIPKVRSTFRSYPMLVRDGMFDRVKLMPFFSSFNFSTKKDLKIQLEMIPFCGVYFLQEFMSPDGDANTGEVRFRTTARYGFSVIIQNNDSDQSESTLDKAAQVISGGLLTDPSLYNNKIFKIQSFSGGTRQHVYGHVGQDQQTPIAELRYELTCDLGVIDYPPFVEDVLEVIHLETIFPIDGDSSRVQQVKVEYDMEQNQE